MTGVATETLAAELVGARSGLLKQISPASLRPQSAATVPSVTLRQSAMWLADGRPRFFRGIICVILHLTELDSPVIREICRLNWVVSIITASSATVATCVALGGPLLPAKTYVIEIRGSPGLGVSGECRLAKADGNEERVPIEGVVPLNLTLSGRGLDCRLERRGPSGTLEVVLSDGQGSTTRSQTSGGSGIIVLSLR